jgi:hypothetical protein
MAYIEQPRSNPSEAASSGEPLGRRLDSWKEIASYLNRSEKTVRRWEEKEGLPVHRLLHEQRGSVYAYASQLDAWLKSRSHLGSHGVNSAGEPFSNVAAEAQPEEENDESPSSRSGPKSSGESRRLRLTAPLLWMLPRRDDHGPADPPAKVGVRTKSRVWARVAVVAGFVLVIGAALLHYGGWQARRKPSPESGSLVRPEPAAATNQPDPDHHRLRPFR